MTSGLVKGSLSNGIDRSLSNGGGGGPQRLITLCVLGKFDLSCGERTIPLGLACQRMLALIALRNGQVNRIQAAGTLWPETMTARAVANLRSALWRLQQTCSDVIDASFHD